MFIRETDEGIEEINKDEKEAGTKQSSGEQNAQVEPAKNAVEREPEPSNEGQIRQTSEEPKKDSVPSTTSDWNTYAGGPARFEVHCISSCLVRVSC